VPIAELGRTQPIIEISNPLGALMDDPDRIDNLSAPDAASVAVTSRLAAECRHLQQVFVEHEEALNLVLTEQDLDPDSAERAVLWFNQCEAQAMLTASSLLDMPVRSLTDLWTKYDTLTLYEDYYCSHPALLKPMLRHIRQDARSMMPDNTPSAPLNVSSPDSFDRPRPKADR